MLQSLLQAPSSHLIALHGYLTISPCTPYLAGRSCACTTLAEVVCRGGREVYTSHLKPDEAMSSGWSYPPFVLAASLRASHLTACLSRFPSYLEVSKHCHSTVGQAVFIVLTEMDVKEALTSATQEGYQGTHSLQPVRHGLRRSVLRICPRGSQYEHVVVV